MGSLIASIQSCCLFLSQNRGFTITERDFNRAPHPGADRFIHGGFKLPHQFGLVHAAFSFSRSIQRSRSRREKSFFPPRPARTNGKPSATQPRITPDVVPTNNAAALVSTKREFIAEGTSTAFFLCATDTTPTIRFGVWCHNHTGQPISGCQGIRIPVSRPRVHQASASPFAHCTRRSPV